MGFRVRVLLFLVYSLVKRILRARSSPRGPRLSRVKANVGSDRGRLLASSVRLYMSEVRVLPKNNWRLPFVFTTQMPMASVFCATMVTLLVNKLTANMRPFSSFCVEPITEVTNRVWVSQS